MLLIKIDEHPDFTCELCERIISTGIRVYDLWTENEEEDEQIDRLFQCGYCCVFICEDCRQANRLENALSISNPLRIVTVQEVDEILQESRNDDDPIEFTEEFLDYVLLIDYIEVMF